MVILAVSIEASRVLSSAIVEVRNRVLAMVIASTENSEI